jgi:uncharacterized protein YggE
MIRFQPLSLVLALLSLSGCVTNHVATSPELTDAVVVVGEGQAAGRPDIAKIELGVEAHAADAKTAVDTVNRKVAVLIEALEAHGVAAGDMQTSSFDINSEVYGPEPPPEPLSASAEMESAPAPMTTPGPPGRRLTYRVSNQLRLTLRNLDRIGDVLGAAVSAGANRVWGMTFEIEDPKPLLQKAREQAMQDARSRAEQLATLGGARLGRVLSVTEQPSSGPIPMPMAKPMAMLESRQVPVEAGTTMVSSQVRVVFAIEAAERAAR